VLRGSGAPPGTCKTATTREWAPMIAVTGLRTKQRWAAPVTMESRRPSRIDVTRRSVGAAAWLERLARSQAAVRGRKLPPDAGFPMTRNSNHPMAVPPIPQQRLEWRRWARPMGEPTKSVATPHTEKKCPGKARTMTFVNQGRDEAQR